VTDDTLAAAARFRSLARFPALTWLHSNGAALCRSAQPLSGLQARSRRDLGAISARSRRDLGAFSARSRDDLHSAVSSRRFISAGAPMRR